MSQLHTVTEPEPMPTDRLVGLISSRICHDLINPLSAISNGVELLGMAPDGTQGPEFQLIKDSVENANARVRFFRIAFGTARPDDTLDGDEVEAVLDAISKGMRQDLHWDARGTLPRREVKLCFLLIQCLETTLPFGGVINVRRTGTTWSLSAQTERFADVGQLWRIITHADGDSDLTAAQVHFSLAATEQDTQSKRIDVTQDQGTMTVTIRSA
ncbi:MAG: histidine phosphotransferase family protein [Pseudomonadota bacterium]